MMKSNRQRRIVRFVTALLLLAAGMPGFTGCITSDDSLGSNYLPGSQEMTAGTLRLAKGRQLFETRLYQTDSIKSSNLGFGYMGASRNDTTGLTESGFMSQFLNYYRVDSGFFGYRPIFDSAQILLSVSEYGRDTLTPQRFNVYEITSSDYIAGGDSLFYLSFDPSKYVASDPLFSFTFPDGTTTGPATKAVTMVPTAKGREFVNRLMISDGTTLYQPGVGYSIYQDDKAFIDVFKGLYIKPADADAMPSGKGSVFGTDLTASGFAIYGRNRVESDPTLIKDTIGLAYYFYKKEFDNKNLSINIVRHDYTGSQIDIADAVETNPDRPLTPKIIVSGLGGVISELTFTQEFFTAIEEEIDRVNLASGMHFTTMAMNRALLTIYFTGGDYDWQLLDQAALIPQMSAALERLGSYTDYKKLTPVVDYDYYAEENYSTTLAYGGYINRSQGCYVLDISGYVQKVWNSYLAARQTAAESNAAKVDLSKVENRSIYLGPQAYGLYTDGFAEVQGMDAADNNAPVKIDLTYTLIK